MVLEKITLQKCLLYFESLHGRPVSPLQLMAPSLARMKNTWETTMMVTTPPTQVRPSCFGVVIKRQHICSGDKGGCFLEIIPGQFLCLSVREPNRRRSW